jgi:hypothetical protein
MGKALRHEKSSEPCNNLYATYTYIFVCERQNVLKNKVQESHEINTAAVKYVAADNRFTVKQV